MTSQINPNNIDGTYPVAGQANNTQGFRDNFTNIKTNFQYAEDEITDLQSKAVLKSALTGTTLDNNMSDNLIYAVKLQDVSYTYLPLTATSGSINIDYAAAPFQQINTTGSVSLSFSNWPASGSAGTVRVGLNITDISHTVTLPAAVSQGITLIAGVSPGTAGVSNTITFGVVGNFAFEFVTIDGGTTVWIFDNSRAPGKINVPLAITANTVSTSTTTGALTVAGGVGISGNLNVGSNFKTYTSTGNVSFQVLDSGIVQFKAPTAIAANSAGALNIVGSTSGNYQAVTNAGGMIHITGNEGVASRITNDAFGTGSNPAYVGRMARGTVDSPTPPQANDVLSRFVGVGWNGSGGYGPTAGGTAPVGIDFVATETYSTTAQGSEIRFYNAPLTSNVRTLSATIASTGITVPGNISVAGTGGIGLTDGGTLGYNTGAGGTVSQGGNKSTGVTLNKPAGEITMQNTALLAATTVQFTLTNSTIGARDVMILNIVGGVATGAAYNLDATCSAGSAVISVRNITAGSLSEAIVLRYAVIKGSVT
jgi:hypothetical protein